MLTVKFTWRGKPIEVSVSFSGVVWLAMAAWQVIHALIGQPHA